MALGSRLGSFGVRMGATAAAIAVLVASLITSATLVRTARERRQAFEVAGRIAVERLAADVAPGVLAGDHADVERTARLYLALPDVTSATVYRGRSAFASIGARLPPGGPVPTVEAGAVRWYAVDGGLVFQAPILSDPAGPETAKGVIRPEVTGVAEVVLSLSRAQAEQRTTVLLNAVLLAFGIALAVLLSTWSARRLARPVRELILAAEQVGQGRLDVSVPVRARDEIGRLGHTFNRMVRDLRNANETRARTERELREHADALREADRRKDEFLAMLAHELRNPLAPISSAAFVLSRSPGGETARRALDALQRQVHHMTRLVDDLLDVSRIQRGKITLRKRSFDLAEVTSRTVQDYRDVFDVAGVSLELRLPGRPVAVEGDETRIAQVLGNLLQNAARFTMGGGRTTVTLETGPGRAVLRVVDTGVGIDPSMQARLFQPFEQADRTLARSTGGLGLGLSLVKGLVALHSGTVEVRSEGEGQGTEVVVELPAQPDAPASRPGRASCLAPGRALRVLVVEDNPDAADTLRLSLELDGHEVEVARDGDEGVAKAGTFAPEVVLCDIGLPGRSGYDVARAIRSDGRSAGALLVAVTGYTTADDVRLAAEAGFDHHLAKPASMDSVRELLGVAAR
jgi:signal transduction histidine kinase